MESVLKDKTSGISDVSDELCVPLSMRYFVFVIVKSLYRQCSRVPCML
jgi:hypothetical protein